jgi:hypothetical protein
MVTTSMAPGMASFGAASVTTLAVALVGVMLGVVFVQRRMDVVFHVRARQALAEHHGHVFVDGTGVGLLFADSQLGE